MAKRAKMSRSTKPAKVTVKSKPSKSKALALPGGVNAGGRTNMIEAGRNVRRLKALPIEKQTINVDIMRYGANVLARSRHLATNNPDATSAKDVFQSALIGCGIVPSPTIKDRATKTAIMEAWAEFVDEADADGLTDFYGMQWIIAAEIFEAGECFVRFRPRRSGDGLFLPFQLQLLPAEMLDLNFNRQASAGQNLIQCGIEFDGIGRRTAYHFWREHPGEALATRSGERTVVPAEEVMHLFKPMRAGQIRGLPHTVSGIVPTAIMDAYEDAMLERARTGTLTVGVVEREAMNNDDFPLEGEGADVTTVEGAIGLEPGAVLDLLPGETFKLHEAPDAGPTYEPFIHRQKLRAAAGYGVPYAEMTGDLRQTSFSSQRSGMIAFKRRIEPIQHHVIVHQLCRPVWARFMKEAVLAGVVPISVADFATETRSYLRVKWIPPRWDWIDPEKDINAELKSVRSGFKSRSDVVESMGGDPEEVDERIAADQKRADAAGLIFDTDARQVSSAGITQARPAGTALPQTDPNAEPEEPAAPSDPANPPADPDADPEDTAA